MAPPLIPGLDPRRIEAEIARVRERESTSFGGGVKANLFNLVVASLPGAHPEEALHALLGRRPARIIRVEAEAAVSPGAAVSGSCSPGTLDRGVCLEQIDLATPGDPLGSGAGAWTPLLARDIPTFLWIAGPWSPQDGAPPLPGLEAVAHADKLIVDSSSAADPMAALAALQRIRRAARRRLAVADLAWSRALPLRVQAARAFDPPAARDALLAGLASVGLVGAGRSEALLFFLWLASRLGWQASASGAGPSFRDAAGRPIAAVHESPAQLACGAQLSFEVRGGPGVAVSCTANGCASIGEDRQPWRIASDGELLLAEVDTLKQDALLDDALDIAAGVAGQPGEALGPADGTVVRGAGDR